MKHPELVEGHFKNLFNISTFQVLNTSSNETVKTRGEEIEEVWIRKRNGNLTLLYKKTDGWLKPAPAVEELVVISYEILAAKVHISSQSPNKFSKKMKQIDKNALLEY